MDRRRKRKNELLSNHYSIFITHRSMKNQNTIFIKTVCIATFLLCSTLLLCCNNDPEKTDAESIVIKTDSLPIQQAKWLLGNWENNSKDGRMTEKW